jgi:hypothetical protein
MATIAEAVAVNEEIVIAEAVVAVIEGIIDLP